MDSAVSAALDDLLASVASLHMEDFGERDVSPLPVMEERSLSTPDHTQAPKESGDLARSSESEEGSSESEASEEELAQGLMAQDAARMDKRRRQKERRKERFGKRRKIKTILKDSELSEATRRAQAEEAERLERMQSQRERATPETGLGEDDEVLLLSDDEASQPSTSKASQRPSFVGGDFTADGENVADAQGRLLVNPAHDPDDPDIFVSPGLAAKLKPHQLGGVRFLYHNIVEDLGRMRSAPGLGCVLAHSMGLGKTLQVITFLDVLFRHTQTKTTLVIVPVNTLQNWAAEVDKWVPEGEARAFRLWVLGDACKTMESRALLLRDWRAQGGVLLIGYELLRRMVARDLQTPGARQREAAAKKAKKRRQQLAGPPEEEAELVDMEEEELASSLTDTVSQALLDPGPDVVVCDEGHRLKTVNASTTKLLKSIRSRRRVVLTGSPLQNNLSEYWCMVDFVRPRFLGSRLEFLNMFERPIKNGQCSDSTAEDKHLARQRTHVLTNMLKGFVQRRSHALLHCILPQKREWVLWMRKSPVQQRLYQRFLTYCQGDSETCNPLKAFAVCCKIWNHPDILASFLAKRGAQGLAEEADLDLDDLLLPSASSSSTSTSSTTPRKRRQPKPQPLPLNIDDGVPATFTQGPGWDPWAVKGINYSWAEDLISDSAYQTGVMENGFKLAVAFGIIEESVGLGDKVLVFSQSLFTLDLMEEYLSRRGELRMGERRDAWHKGRTYFRLDGSTNGQERQKLISRFEEETEPCLFLISTRAGSLGINLTSANRAIVMDASWNPTHDTQAICRIFRYGQAKPTFVYRLVTDNSMERSIFNRQLGKMGIADRVLDSKASDPNVTREELRNLLTYVPELDTQGPAWEPATWDSDDEILSSLCSRVGSLMLSQPPVPHESLLMEGSEREMSSAEKRRAQAAYERELREVRGIREPGPLHSYVRGSMAELGQASPSPGALGLPFTPSPFAAPLFASSGQQHKPMGIIRPQAREPEPSLPPLMPTLGALASGNTMRGIGPPLRLKQIICSREARLPAVSSGAEVVVPVGTPATILQTQDGVYLRLRDGYLLDAAGSVYDVRTDPDFQAYPPPRRGPITNRMMASGPLPPPPKRPARPTGPPELVDLCDSD